MPALLSTRVKLGIVCCLAGVAGLAVAGSAAPRAHADPQSRQPAALPAAPSPAPHSPSTATPTGSATPGTSSPDPAPAPSPTPPGQETGDGGCGVLDMTCRAGRAIDAWFRGLVTSAINPVFDMVGGSLLATPRLDQMPRVRGLWTGSLVIANSCFVLLAVIGALIVMGYQSVQTSYAVKDVTPRLVIAVVVANISLLLVGHAIDIANALSAALLGQGVNPEEAAAQLKKIILHALNPADVGIFLILVVCWAVLLGTVLTVVFVIRIILTILLVAAAPLALACHALPFTNGLAALWWRAFAGVLAIQVAQALVFITAMRVALTGDMVTIFGLRTPGDQVDLWITLCLLYILVRIPSWVSRLVWRGGTAGSPLMRAAKTIAALVVFRGLLGRTSGGRPRMATAGRSPRGPGTFGPGEMFATRPLPAGVGAHRWVQPPLPFERSSPHGVQLTLPFDLPASARRPRHVQLQLPLRDHPPSTPAWGQTELPLRIRHEQLQLPLRLPAQYTQPRLPLDFPERGTAGAGTPRPANPAAQQHAADWRARERERRTREELRTHHE